jgi:hypothetical protein
VLYRDTLAWKALPPGEQGKILTLSAALRPEWRTRRDYYPAAMQYDGATGFYHSAGINITNQGWTFWTRFATDTSGTNRRLLNVYVGVSNPIFARLDNNNRFQCEALDSAGITKLRIRSKKTLNDGKQHTVWCEYNNITGTPQLLVDGADDDDTAYGSRLTNPATFTASANGNIAIGGRSGSTFYWPGQIGPIGWTQKIGLDPTDFQEPDGWPKPLNTTTWTEFAGQPPLFHHSGKADENQGAEGPIAKNGTILLADPTSWS